MQGFPVSSDNPGIAERLVAAPQYSLGQAEKSALLAEELDRLTASHSERCEIYRRIVEGRSGLGAVSPRDVPFIPVRLFKTLKLQSIPDSEVIKVPTSSGTTSQQVSRVAVDRETSRLQTSALASIITSFIGPKRLPMIILDTAAVLQNRASMSARGAGLVGLSNFGHSHFYALDEDLRLDLAGLKAFLDKHGQQPVLLFGFTFMVWQYFHNELRRLGERLDIPHGILIHSGGWKKLQEQQVSNQQFKADLLAQCGIRRVHNFYGMVEQVGGIYMECDHGCFHAPNVADVIIRDARDWSVAPTGTPGVLQTMSVLPRSYPGHSLLTEDTGVILGVDDCPCGRKGTRFEVLGRIPQAELRGCSDTHAYNVSGPAAGGVRQFLPVSRPAAGIREICTPEFLERQPLDPFAPVTTGFLDEVSRAILENAAAKKTPDLVALAFWLRKANIHRIVSGFLQTVGPGELTKPWGVIFHVAPGNVDTIFLYSWALGILTGNLNVVRVSEEITESLGLLLGILEQVLRQPCWNDIAQRNIVLTYPRDEETSRFLSQHADVRVIWGGDETVQTLRALPTKLRTRDIAFADKVSSTVVHATRHLEKNNEGAAAIAASFYNDAYQFDQLACSSPHFVFFIGPRTSAPRPRSGSGSAWTMNCGDANHAEAASVAMTKLVAACELLAHDPDATTRSFPVTGLAVAHLPLASASRWRARIGGGFFLESFAAELESLAPVIQPSDQTLTYAGFTQQEMTAAAARLCQRGLDRIVPLGQALAFGPVWDGYVLLSELTRRVVVS